MRKHFVMLANGTHVTILADDVIIGGPNSIEVTMSWNELGEGQIGNRKHSRVAIMQFDSRVDDCYSEEIITPETKFALRCDWNTPVGIWHKGHTMAVEEWATVFGVDDDKLIEMIKEDKLTNWLEETI